jgi:hypothetical protein
MGAPKINSRIRFPDLNRGEPVAKSKYTEYRVRVPGEETLRTFTRAWDAGKFLLPWCYMDPDVAVCAWEGPQYRYTRTSGRTGVAKIPVTATLRTGEIEYRDFLDERLGIPESLEIKREHCRLEGLNYRLYDYAFYEENLTEATNRKHAYFLLLNATRNFDLAAVEAQVLTALGRDALNLSEIGRITGQSTLRVRAAALNLWRKGRVVLPMADSLMTDSWTATRLSDAGH